MGSMTLDSNNNGTSTGTGGGWAEGRPWFYSILDSKWAPTWSLSCFNSNRGDDIPCKEASQFTTVGSAISSKSLQMVMKNCHPEKEEEEEEVCEIPFKWLDHELLKVCLLSPHRTVNVISWHPGNEITFTEADLPPDWEDHIRALLVTVESQGMVLPAVLVDNGSALNVMPLKTFVALGYDRDDLSPCPLTVTAYDNSTRNSLGEVTANVKLGMLESQVRFTVLDISASFNLLLGRPWLHALRAVPSTLHQKVKLPFKMENQYGILTIEGEI